MRSASDGAVARAWFRSSRGAWRPVRGLVAAAGAPARRAHTTRRGFVLSGLFAATLLAPATAHAHKPSDAHVAIAISGEHVTGNLAVALRDLDGALDLDANGNGNITWSEAQAAAPRITTYARERLVLDGCTLAFGAGKLVDFSDGAYWAMPITGTCEHEPATVTYNVLFDLDAQHRGIVQVATAHETRTVVARDATPIAIPTTRSPLAYAAAGATRVWTSGWGLIVLACLLLPLVMIRRDRAARSSRGARASGPRGARAQTNLVLPRTFVPYRSFVASVLRGLGGLVRSSDAGVVRSIAIVTASYVLGCGATLVLATSGIVMLPGAAIVAPVVAASAIVAALLNLVHAYAARRDGGAPLRTARRDLAFELGLVYGFGAALWLDSTRIGDVLGFAIGVAIAQIAFVAIVASALYIIRRTLAYRVLVWGGSAVAAIGTLAWMCLT
jgi:hypothetical protein